MAFFAFVKLCCDGGGAAQAQNPTITDPTFKLENSVGPLAKIGEERSISLAYGYDRGAIDGSAYGGSILPRGGAATAYTFSKPDGSPFSAAQVNGNMATVTYQVIKGYNDLLGKVVYEAGLQPKNSQNADYLAPYPAGNNPQTSRIEGVYPIFTGLAGIATTDKLGAATTYDDLQERSLVSMITGNYIEYILPAEQNSGKQAFAIANAWLADRPLAKIEYFNELLQQWDGTDNRPDFTTNAANFSVASTNVAYTQYKNISPDRGPQRLRFIF